MTAEELYTAWRGRLIDYFGRRVSPQEAEDLTHDLFVRYLRTQASGVEIRKPQRWIWRVARNLVNDYYRSPARRREIAVAPLEDVDAPDPFAPDPLALALAWDDRREVAKYLLTLSPAQLEVIRLRHQRGWDNQQIADVLGITHNAVKARLCRAVARLRELMEE